MKRLVMMIAAAACLRSWEARSMTQPAPPSVFFDTGSITQRGRIIPVPEGGDFQAALDQAQPGDVILLEAGATFAGSFVLPVKSGPGWIVVRTSAPDSSLPRPGHRIDPSYAASLPKLVSPHSLPAIRAAPGANYLWFLGIEVHPAPGTFSFNLVELGASETSEVDLPNHLIFDRCYIHGDPLLGSRRGIAMNGKWIAVIDSYISDFKDTASDSQAVAGWNGSGPFKIVNNYLEAAGDNVLFGGADPQISGLVPSDIEVRGNHFFKPVSWMGSAWQVKNLLELKNARRVLVDGNIFEHNWPAAQNGFSILFTVRNQDGTAPWSVVEDVTFTHNIVRHVSSAMNILGQDDLYPSQQMKRILIQNNLFNDVSAANWGGFGRLFQMLSGTANVTIDHNTAFHTGDVISASGIPHTAFYYQNNLSPHNQYGVGGSGTYGNPLLTLGTYFPDAIFVRNVLAGGNPVMYPIDNFFPPTLADVGFVDLEAGDYRLAAGSPFKNAGTDGEDLGADVEAVLKATAGVEAGINNEPPDCRAALASPSVLWPPNHKFVEVRIVNVTDPNNDPLTIRITGVTQNEAVEGQGDGATAPDVIIQADRVLLRAERSGGGSGRIYYVHFTADDGFGGSCQATVTVEVPR